MTSEHEQPQQTKEDRLGIGARGPELTWLRANWGQWYYIGWQAGEYFAVRRDDSSTCRRTEAGQLDRELAADFAARPSLLF
jgi:hypothetical protein